jgi:hypothetical protein
VQFSATSQTPATGRQTVAEDTKEFAGQVLLEPLQFSAVSQTPALARQTVELGSFASAGHAEEDPLQVSTASQTPAAARQLVPALTKRQFEPQQAPFGGSHCSETDASTTPLPQRLVKETVTK